MSKKNKDKKLSVTETASYIGLSRIAVIKAITKRKTLKAEKIGNQWTVNLSEAERYKKQNKGKPGRPKKKQLKLKF